MEKPPVKICFATSSLGKGGAEKQLYLLLKHLDRNAFAPEVIAFADGPWMAEIQALDISVSILRAPTRRRRLWLCFRHLLKTKPQVVHCFGASAGFILRPAAILARVPRIIASERYAVETKSSLKLLSEKVLGMFTDYLICNAQHSATFYEEKAILPRRKLRVIKNGIETREIGAWKPPNAPVIGYLANLRDGKNHEFLIHAFHALKSRMPEVRLLLAGDGARRRYLESLIDSLALKDSIELLGTINDQSAFFNQISVYCHISLFEGIPNSVMEAMARGLPCIVSDIAGNRELVVHEHNGILVSPSSIAELSSAIALLLEDQATAAKYGQNARSTIAERFSVAQMIDATAALYPKASNA